MLNSMQEEKETQRQPNYKEIKKPVFNNSFE